ncbi:hypothetical protein H5410_044406 [Solanum commersonii]|uniref:Uncharacterized protein n=1 Tax=Solanum commersonii TaxID=4109 RepID=A0A9J5X9T1_SOLCO|nr:hypothetical protein H5410_044406 [Solanum commersonii]
MRMLKWMCGLTRRDIIRNEDIHAKVEVTMDKMRKSRMRWFGHVKRRCMDAPAKRCERLTIEGLRRGRGRPKKYWGEEGMEVEDWGRRLVVDSFAPVEGLSEATSSLTDKVEVRLHTKSTFLLSQLPVSKPVLKKRTKEKLNIHLYRCSANYFLPIVAVTAQQMSGRIRHLFILRLVCYLRYLKMGVAIECFESTIPQESLVVHLIQLFYTLGLSSSKADLKYVTEKQTF